MKVVTRRIAVLLAVVLLFVGIPAGLAVAEVEPNTKLFSYCEQMWFCNGVGPDAGYDGCLFREMDAGRPDSTLGDCKGAGDTTVVVGRVSTTKHYGLLSFDISAIPDSAVVVWAKLYVKLQSSAGTTQNKVENLSLVRLLRPWNEMATWNTSEGFDDPELDEVWGAGGASDTLGTGSFFGGVDARVDGSNRGYKTPGTYVVATLSGALNYSTPDSIYESPPPGASVDIDSWPVIGSTSTGYSVLGTPPVTPGWVGFDVLRDVKNWHTGNWANYGWRMIWGGTNGMYWTLYGNCSTVMHRPRLLVKYLYAVPGDGGGRRRGSFGVD